MRATGKQVCQLWGCWQELLEVIDHEQQVFVFQEGFEYVHERQRSALLDFERLCDGGNDQRRVVDRSE